MLMFKKKPCYSPREREPLKTLEEQNVCGDDASSSSNINIYVWKNKKIRIKKVMIPVRIALFLWFGASAVPMSFLSVFMKQKGLTVLEFSSVFSLTFLAQLIISLFSGIVADKIGNAKPVLIFHMLATVTVLIGMLLTPSVGDKHSDPSKMNLTCFDWSDRTTINLTHCNSMNLTDNAEYSRKTCGSFAFVTSINNSRCILDFAASEFSNDNSKEVVDILACVSVFCKELQEKCTSFCASFGNGPSSGDKKFKIILQVLILSFVTFWTSVYRFFEITVMFLVKKHDSSFGLERTFANAGDFFGAVLIAFVLGASTTDAAEKNYDIVYWVSSSFILLSSIAVCLTRVPIKPPGENLMVKALKLIRNLDTISFLFIVFVLGNAYCYNFSFNFLLLEKLNAPKMLFGLHSAATTVYGLPMLLTAKWWLKKLDTTKVFVLCLLMYVVSDTSYSFLQNPWYSLAIESTTAFTYHLMCVTTVVHSHAIAPKGMASTIIILPGLVHYGLARSTGVLGFGSLTSVYGQRTTYRIIAAMCLTTAVLYTIFLYCRHLYSTKESAENGSLEPEITDDPDSRNVHVDTEKYEPIPPRHEGHTAGL